VVGDALARDHDVTVVELLEQRLVDVALGGAGEPRVFRQ
jgi:hypothetical protein